MPGPRREPARRIADGWSRLQRGDADQAVARQAEGLPLRPFPAMLHTVRLARRDVEGAPVDEGCSRLAPDPGRHDAAILRNHGVLACGRTIADASAEVHHPQRACEAQPAVQGSGAAVTTPPCAVAPKAAGRHGRPARGGTRSKLPWQAVVRWMDDLDPKYRT